MLISSFSSLFPQFFLLQSPLSSFLFSLFDLDFIASTFSDISNYCFLHAFNVHPPSLFSLNYARILTFISISVFELYVPHIFSINQGIFLHPIVGNSSIQILSVIVAQTSNLILYNCPFLICLEILDLCVFFLFSLNCLIIVCLRFY